MQITNLTKIWIFILAVLASGFVSAQSVVSMDRDGNLIYEDQVPLFATTLTTLSGSPVSFSDKSFSLANILAKANSISDDFKNSRIQISIVAGDDFKYGFANYNLTAGVDDIYFGGTIIKKNASFELTDSKPEAGFNFEVSSLMKTATDVSLTGNGQLSYNFTGSPSPSAANSLLLLNSLKVRIRITTELRTSTSSIANVPYVCIGDLPVSNGKQYKFTWNVVESGTTGPVYDVAFAGYEFQLLRLYNRDISTTTYPITAEVDWSKALTIQLTGEKREVALAINEGEGYYMWRTRVVGSSYDGGFANPYNYGEWHQVSPTQMVLHPTTPSNYVFYFNDANDASRNTISTRYFSENNSRKEVVQYGTYLNQPKQTQVYIPSKDITIISNNIYDYSGRSAVSVLPYAKDNNGQAVFRGYEPGVTTVGYGSAIKPYTADNFDRDSKIYNADEMTGSVRNYYSGGIVKPEGTYPIPDAQGYPYSRTVFFADKTDRHLESSGPASKLRMTKDDPHTTRTYYSNPSEIELIRVFGAEAPKKEDILKTVVVDPNNTATVTYTNKMGKVIATCLSDNPGNDNLLGIGENIETVPDKFTVWESVPENQLSQGNLVAAKRLSFHEPTDVYFSYKCNFNEISVGCAEGNCTYDIVYSIINVDDPSKSFKTVPETVNCSAADSTMPDWSTVQYANPGTTCTACSCSTALSCFQNIYTVVSPKAGSAFSGLKIPAGNYIFEKILMPTADGKNSANANLIARQKKITIFTQAINILIKGITGDAALGVFYTEIADIRLHGFDPSNTLYSTIPGIGEYSTTDFPMAEYGINTLDEAGTPTTEEEDIASISVITPYNTAGSGGGGGGCCGGPVSLSLKGLKKMKSYKCNTDEEGVWANYQHTTPRKDYDFYGYLADNIEALMIRSYEAKGQAIPVDLNDKINDRLTQDLNGYVFHGATGTVDHEFNAMIFHMLNDKYYTGKAHYDDVNDKWYKANEDGTLILPKEEAILTTQYSCSDLWDCWIAVVGTYTDAMEVMGAPTKSIADSSDKTDNKFDDAFDNNEAVDMGPLMKWIVSRKLSSEMRKQEKVEIKSGLVTQFLECAKYKFAQIIVHDGSSSGVVSNYSPDNVINTSPTPTPIYIGPAGDRLEFYYGDKSQTPDLVPHYKLSTGPAFPSGSGWDEYIPNPVAPMQSRGYHKTHGVLHPNLKDKIFAFKYFEYNDENVFVDEEEAGGSCRTGVYNNSGAEMASCFYAEPAAITLCNPSRCVYGHETWSSSQRTAMFLILRDMPPPPTDSELGIVEEANTDIEEVDCNNSTEIETQYATPYKSSCEAACEERRANFRAAVMGKLKERCYDIGGCGANAISYAQIDKISSELVSKCKGEFCDITASDFTCTVVSCTTITCQPITYTSVVMKECKQLMMEQAKYWGFDVDFPAATGCDVSLTTSLANGTSINTAANNATIPTSNAGCSPDDPEPSGGVGTPRPEYSPVRKYNVTFP